MSSVTGISTSTVTALRRAHCPGVRPISEGDRELLREIVRRRRPALRAAVDRLGTGRLSAATLEALRLAVVDEACETPAAGEAARRVLALGELLAGLAAVPARGRGPR